jgi:diheme cytochrome c
LPRGALKPLWVLLALGAAACSPELPDADTPGAMVMRQRCASCHPLYAPRTMTLDMWKVKVEAMRPRFAERGMAWLTPAEERALLDYLAAHAGRS